MAKLLVSTHQKKHFYNIWGSFWKIEFLTENRQARTLQNSENFVLSQNGVRKYFLAKLFVPLIKRNISTTFEAVFGKLNFWQKNWQARTSQNSENFVLSQNGVRKIFFGKIICSTHQKNNFYNIWGNFWKIEFLTENRQARTLQNSENFVLSQNGVRKYFLAKLFVPLIKINISTTFEAVFGKWILDGKSTGADLTK